MALIYFNGFDFYGTTNTTFDGWSLNLPDSTGRFSGDSLSFNGSGTMSRSLGANYATLIGGIAFFRAVATAANITVLGFMDGASTQIGVAVNTARVLIVFRGTTATVLATGTTPIPDGVWQYVELKATINNAGTFEVYLNGVQEIASTAADTQNTANAFANAIMFQSATSNITNYDDLYICDDTGGAPANTFLGEIRIDPLFPTGAGSSAQFTPSAGSNYQNVDETDHDTNTTYNESSTAGHVDLFAMGNIPTTPATIFGVDVWAYARKDDAGARTFRTKLKSGATTSNGATTALTTSFLAHRTVYTTDPNTAAAWTQTNVDALEAGYECVA